MTNESEPMKSFDELRTAYMLGIIDGLDRFKPFDKSDDPVLWSQYDTVVRIQHYLKERLGSGDL